MIKDADRSVGATISHRVCQEQRTRVHRATQSVVRQRTSCTVFRRSIPDEKRFFPGISVPVLTRRADRSLVALNPAHLSRLLPALSVWFSMTFVRRTTTNSSTSSLRISWENRGSVYGGDGHCRHLPGAESEQAESERRSVSVLIASHHQRLSESYLGDRYHLHSLTSGLDVSGGHPGLVLALCDQLGTRSDPGNAVCAYRRPTGLRTSGAADLQ
jgi:hypothetical protein